MSGRVTPDLKVANGEDQTIDYAAVLRQWIREEVAEMDVVDEGVLIEKIIKVFSKREGFWEGLVAQQLRTVLKDMVGSVLGSVRHGVSSHLANVVSFRDGKTMSRKDLKDKARSSSAFAAWRERVGVGVTVKLTAMTKTDIKAACELRTGWAEGNLRVVRWLEKLAENLKDGQKVEDVWTLEEIRAMWEEVNGSGGEVDK